MLRGASHAKGSGALAVAAVVAGMLVLASAAFAVETSPPSFLSDLKTEVFSTRANVRRQINTGFLSVESKAEYITAKALEDAEAKKEEAKWIALSPEDDGPDLAGGGIAYVYFGINHLTPDTAYYERFVVENADDPGKPVEQRTPFKTDPVAEPEVPTISSLFIGSSEGELEFRGGVSASEPSTASFTATIETNGADTKYAFEYSLPEAGHAPAASSSLWKVFPSAGATGTITAAEEAGGGGASITGLAPETTYYVRLKASNAIGTLLQTEYQPADESGSRSKASTFTTPTAKPITHVDAGASIRNVTTSSAHVSGEVYPHGSETEWRFEYAESLIGPWTEVPGAEGKGTISGAQAAAAGFGHEFEFVARLTGLSPSTKYYVRLFAKNAVGEGEVCRTVGGTNFEEGCEPISESTETGLGIFETFGSPSVTTFAVHSLQGESLQLLGGVNPNDTPTSAEQTITVEGAPTGGTFTLTFNGHTTKPIAYNAPALEGEGSGSVEEAVRHELVGGPQVDVQGPAGGPYTVFFTVGDAGVAEPPIEADGSGLTPSGTVKVATVYKGGETTEVHYHFSYLSQKQYEATGWTGAQETAEAVAPPGGGLQVVRAALPALTGGETYRYRILATSSAGGGVIEGSEQTLTVPAPPAVGPVSCPNEAFRTGLSAHLPDCRAYEMVTPVDKEGAQEPWQYLIGFEDFGLVGEDGEHFTLQAPAVHWGAGSGAGGSPYFFTREAGKGWAMKAGTPQPETGLDSVYPEMYSADLGAVAFHAEYNTSQSNRSAEEEFKVGPAGGPYTTVASLPRNVTQNENGWETANASFSKLVFGTTDHELLGEATGTRSGLDIYEYTASGGLRQLNVSGESNTTIGTCGASAAAGQDGGSQENVYSRHSISVDGSRVFFEAVPGKNCGEAKNLYMRVDGQETVDLGAYKFLSANAEGTRLLVQKGAGELLGYDVETGATEAQSSDELAAAQELALLGIPSQRIEAGEGAQAFSHSRYTYWSPSSISDAYFEGAEQFFARVAHDSTPQVYRYDSVEHVVECISCASSFDPDPKQPSFLSSNEGDDNGHMSTTSANGDFAFFQTAAALVPQDVDGEVEVVSGITNGKDNEYGSIGGATSPSSDVYEWRAAGVNGCARVQGCLALITDGRGGFMNLLFGSADEGRDVFIYTRSKLLGQDDDTAGDIYDVRVDGGLPGPPARPTECEGDACSTPPPAPVDQTPSSLTFSGEGNIAQSAPGKAVVKSAKPKAKKKKTKHGKAQKTKHGKNGMRAKSKAKKSGDGRGQATRSSGRGK